MATLQAASGTANSIDETILGSQLFKIEGFSATKDLGVGKSIKSSTFSVGGHDWYIECYPCGVDVEKGVDRVALFLCLSVHVEQVEATCTFWASTCSCGTSGDPDYSHLRTYKHTYNAETSWRSGSDVLGRAEAESFLEDDCFLILCEVCIVREFPARPQPYLHQPLGGEPFTVSRRLQQVQDPSAAHVAAIPTSAAASTDNKAGSHVLTIEGYSNMKKRYDCLGSCLVLEEWFLVAGQRWQIELYPNGQNDDSANCLAVVLNSPGYPHEELKARVEFTLLTLAREIMASTQFCCAFTRTNGRCGCYFPFNMEPQSSLLFWDSFHVKCDVTIIKEITPVQPPDLHLHFGNLLASQVGTDVEFEVGGDLFSAHKCVLATRSTAFMAEFFGPAGNGGSSTTTVTRVPIKDMEPRVFKALLHFIYTDTLPEVPEDDKVMMAQGLLVAADRYAMERLKLICGDLLCNYMNDARTAVATLELANKHGCRRLMEACIKLLKGHFAKEVTP